MAKLGYQATLPNSPAAAACDGLLHKAHGRLGGSDKAGDGESALNITVIGSGGAAMAGALRAAARGAQVTVAPSTLTVAADKVTVDITIPMNRNGLILPRFTSAKNIRATSTLRTERAE